MDAPALEARCHPFLYQVREEEFLGSRYDYGNMIVRPQHVSFLFIFFSTSIFTAKKSPLSLFIHQSSGWSPQLISTAKGTVIPACSVKLCILQFPKEFKAPNKCLSQLTKQSRFPMYHFEKKGERNLHGAHYHFCENRRYLVYNISYSFLS